VFACRGKFRLCTSVDEGLVELISVQHCLCCLSCIVPCVLAVVKRTHKFISLFHYGICVYFIRCNKHIVGKHIISDIGS
jgi:hypothetical protein